MDGSAIVTLDRIADPIADPLRTLEKWLSGGDLAALAGIADRVARKAIASRRWRGADLLVQEVQIGRGGAGGKALQVHVDSLPADLRESWYISHGITLHEKPDTETGKTVLVPEQTYQNDARFEADLALARWRQEVIRPILILEKGSPARAELIEQLAQTPRLFPNGKRKAVTKQTLYNWVKAFEAEGLNGLIRKRRADSGAKRQKVTRAWDAFFEAHIDAAKHAEISDELTTYIRSLWAAGERGWRSITEKSTTRLIEMSRGLDVLAFDALELGRCGDTNAKGTQFGICNVNRRQVEHHREYALLAIKDKDNATFQDSYMPSIRRDYTTLLPRQIVVGDVHPVDIMMRRPDGTVVYPKAIAWYDVATNEIHMTFVLLQPGEGIRREHVAQSFEAMVEEWGLPELLYLDNGSEYSWDAMIGGFTQLSQLTQGGLKVFDLDGDPNVAKRVANGREAVVRSMPYNAKGKPGIEGAFGNIEQVFFATIPGWTAGDRMNKKTHAKGKDPVAFDGDAQAFLETAGKALEWYHKRPQHGRLNGMSPNEALRNFIDQGWGKTTLSRPEVLALAFAEEIERMPDRGRVSYTPRRGETMYFYADELLGLDHKITLRVPAFNPEFVFCFADGELICQAFPEQTFGVLDGAGAQEVNRRGKAFRRQIAEKRRHVALLSLTEETERHIAHMPDAPEAPVAAIVDAGIIDRMARMDAEARENALADAANKSPRKPLEQWKTGPVKALENFKFAEEESDG
ncbi:helix-turn-helix domain-containing protein [Candidatus Rhodobacter oscarellae]|uniref:helix-turn-helix domain-containing protein n=1 Tax=Candidatus Rhodobacter oscarellae TaxID=1675527 RepID=UPI000B227270|nr:helix-turn-helix domain-containing protein [Candidatus Rhodobacter lobularis]